MAGDVMTVHPASPWTIAGKLCLITERHVLHLNGHLLARSPCQHDVGPALSRLGRLLDDGLDLRVMLPNPSGDEGLALLVKQAL